jgi:hypothetical protein
MLLLLFSDPNFYFNDVNYATRVCPPTPRVRPIHPGRPPYLPTPSRPPLHPQPLPFRRHTTPSPGEAPAAGRRPTPAPTPTPAAPASPCHHLTPSHHVLLPNPRWRARGWERSRSGGLARVVDNPRRSGYPKTSGRVIRVLESSGNEIRYPIISLKNDYPIVQVPASSGSGSGIPDVPENM